MTYEEAIQTLYNQAPMFQHVGKAGYKEGLENTIYIDKYYQEPHHFFPTIHIAGTNGKGSTSHLMAAALQSAGLKVGLYTSPHLVDFSERIRINGEEISHEYVADFIEKAQPLIMEVQPSFFEITTSLAFCYFRDMNVDVAVIEVGLGGRLDCTNVITPLVSVITNISLEHTDLLGDTVEKIAYQKAGIIKKGVPVVVGERDERIMPVFEAEAAEVGTAIVPHYEGDVPRTELLGEHQLRNARTAFMALREVAGRFGVTDENIAYGFSHVVELTGLMGRWQTIGTCPRVICDVGHNAACLKVDVEQLAHERYNRLRVVFGVVADKDYEKMLSIMPSEATYYYVQANIPRALDGKILSEKGSLMGRMGEFCGTVDEGYRRALGDAAMDDLVLVCGSNFTVAELLCEYKEKQRGG
ncbi:MAG: bifunctional folylpolyglutamate synthase/dihydrofolate synthase [Paludibacteraceae bacterium]|nr:bifunctional folylpolyglutamate synthase/dihydrofolate synthase [Paludibacteraceae bacterium]